MNCYEPMSKVKEQRQRVRDSINIGHYATKFEFEMDVFEQEIRNEYTGAKLARDFIDSCNERAESLAECLSDAVRIQGFTNANLIRSRELLSGTVATETGLTPRQLAEQRAELVAALEAWVFAWKAWEVTGIPKTPEESELIFNNACAALARAKGAK